MTSPKPNRAAKIGLRCISLYQAARAGRPTSCRFHPSCSAYATEAIATRGLVRGTGLALRRLARCRPFGAHGIDPVPPAHGAA